MKKIDDTLVLKLHKEGRSQRYIARQLKCSKSGVLKKLRKLIPDYGNRPENQKETSVSTKELPKPKYSKQLRYLQKVGTDQIFIWTKYLAIRTDMREVRFDGEKFVFVYFGDQQDNSNPYH